MLNTGIAWRDLPQELGYDSGGDLWRRLRDWQAAGVWDQLHQRLLVRPNAAAQDRLVTGRGRLQPRAGGVRGLLSGPSPVDHARVGSKHYLLVEASGIPLAVSVTGGQRNDVTQLAPWAAVDRHGPPAQVAHPLGGGDGAVERLRRHELAAPAPLSPGVAPRERLPAAFRAAR